MGGLRHEVPEDCLTACFRGCWFWGPGALATGFSLRSAVPAAVLPRGMSDHNPGGVTKELVT